MQNVPNTQIVHGAKYQPVPLLTSRLQKKINASIDSFYMDVY